MHGFVVLGSAVGFWLIVFVGWAAAQSRKTKAIARGYQALADERGWQYQDCVPVPDWVGAAPRPPSHPRSGAAPAACRRCLTGTYRNHRVQLFELVYPRDDSPDRVCSVACLLDPPPLLPTIVATAAKRGRRPQPDPFVIDAAGSAPTTYDLLPPMISLLEGWPEIHMWGIGDVIWTLVPGEFQPHTIDHRLRQLDAVAGTILTDS